MSNLLELITGWINERGSSTILRERLIAIHEEADKLSKRVVALEEENAKLVQQLRDALARLEKPALAGEFIEHRGVLLRRNKHGDFDPEVYCFECRVPLTSDEHGFFCLKCPKCKRKSNFYLHDIDALIEDAKRG